MTKANRFSRLAIGAAAAALLAVPLAAAPRMTPQQELDKLLAGRVAGKPVNCIDPRSNTETHIIDKTAIVYGSGRTIYVQRPTGAESLSGDPILVTVLHGSGQLCNIDIVQLHDRSTGFNRGFVGLNQFVPYTKVALRD
ncbi:hypothetical protein H7F51_16280 [Novosphingobium flavum]|uniref:Uncharacterized protein n=1 Tax=Novosphingobium flavum TaxID=1778672 RepID=A0A7X1KMY3_9SPHN|nr:hypothetical protein [Novosphingobium flavum]MBC2667077.1 hypothetical protein [Novosphingobium flavum]